MAFYTPFAEGDPATPSTFNDRFDETGVSLNARGISPMERAANGDGINDDRAVLAEIDALDDALLLPAAKTFLVASDLTLSGRVKGYGGLIKPDNGVTVTLGGSFEAGLFQCFDLSAGGSVTFSEGVLNGSYPQWWGGMAPDTTDDTDAIQAAADALGGSRGGTLKLTQAWRNWQISDHILIGRPSGISFNASNVPSGDFAGFAGAKGHFTIEGDVGFNRKITWTGDAQPGTTKVTASDSVGTYDWISDAKPMFQFWGGRFFTFRNLHLDGDDLAHAGIHFEGNQFSVTMENCKIEGCKMPVRNGTRWDEVNGVTYWGLMNAPYYKANVSDVTALGGWQGDSHNYTCCSFSGEYAYSTESEQNLSLTFTACGFVGRIQMVGGRVNLIQSAFLGTNTASDVTMITGTNRLFGRDIHVESDSTYFLTTQTGATEGTVVDIDGLDGDKSIHLQTGGWYSLRDARLDTIKRTRNASGSRVWAKLENCRMKNIRFESDAVGNAPSFFLEGENIECYSPVGADLFDHDGSGVFFIGTVKNVTPSTNFSDDYSRTYSQYSTAITSRVETSGLLRAQNGLQHVGTLGLNGAAPVAQGAAIAAADGTLADITTKFNSLLTYLRSRGDIDT